MKGDLQSAELRKHWSDTDAMWCYELVHFVGTGRNIHYGGTGNLAWAKRIAKHYNISIPTKEFNNG